MNPTRGAAGDVQSKARETRALTSVAMPLIAAYLAEFAMFLTTKLVVGELGFQQFAAVGIAGHLSFEIAVVLMGLLSIVGVLVAHAHGSGRPRDAGRAVRQGAVLATLAGVPAVVLVWNLHHVLALTGQDPAVTAFAAPFLKAVSAFVLPALWFSVLRSFVAGLGRTQAVMVITVVAVGLNYLLTLALVHGRFGLPALGVAGAGLALNLVTWLMFLALVAYVYRNPVLRGYGVFAGRLRVDVSVCLEIVRLGGPVAGLVVLEAGLFTAVAILSGVLGAINLAAFEVIMAWIGIPFVIALGFAEATMVRVAYWVGAGSFTTARRSGLLGMVFGVALVSALVIVPLGMPDVIVRLFIEADDPGFADIAALAGQLFAIVAVFQVFDGLQALASRALRGVRDTIVPLWLAGTGYWVFGIGGGSALAFPLAQGSVGLWWGLAIGITITAVLLTWRFVRLTEPRRLEQHLAAALAKRD